MILLTIFLGLSHVIHYQAGNFLEYFIYYIVFVMLFACGTGIAVNVLV